MKYVAPVLLLAALLLLGLAMFPGPGAPSQTVQATHRGGDIICPSAVTPVHDGVVMPGEYVESFFDPQTKILIYFGCLQDSTRTMHVAMVSPSEDWTELRFQAVDEWNGNFNVAQFSLSEAGLTAIDGFIDGETGTFAKDLSLGGTDDLWEPVGAYGSDFQVIEFGVPLLSQDYYDSRLTQNGSFYFQLAHAKDGGVSTESDLHFIQIGPSLTEALWTVVELSLPEKSAPAVGTEVLLTLRDEWGRPLSFRSISVFARTAFGFLDIGTAVTNEQGVASANYAPRDEGSFLVGAAFPGERGYLASVTWKYLVVAVSPTGPEILPSGIRLIEATILLVVGGVWATFAYTIYIVKRALREEGQRSTGPRGGGMFRLPRLRRS